MAKGQKIETTVKSKYFETPKKKWEFPLGRNNFYTLLIGLGVILLGYALMATGITDEPAIPDGKWNNFLAVAVAPVLLLLGYCVIINAKAKSRIRSDYRQA